MSIQIYAVLVKLFDAIISACSGVGFCMRWYAMEFRMHCTVQSVC